MNIQQLTKLKIPDSPGVYTFRDYKKRPLYIGRATDLRSRVKSYFSNDIIETRGPRIVDMITKAKFLTWQETNSVLEAVILEATLIRRYQPSYNVDERDDKSSQYVIITKEEWPRVFLVRLRDFDQCKKEGTLPYEVKKQFGPFIESGLIKEALKILRRLFPFRDKKAHDPRREAFYRALGRSPEKNEEDSKKQYARTIRYLILFFEGKSKSLRSLIKREMKQYIRELKFEEAGQNNRLLYALDHINDIALIKREREQADMAPGSNSKAGSAEFRLEAYDVAHLSGTHVVGAMTVSINGQFAPSEYRKFKISRDTNNDIAGLTEILFRRLNHTEWTYPDIIIVDGNETHVRAAENVLKARRISIPIVAVTKDERHKADRLIGHPELVERYKREIIALNAECHRFAIGYHRKRRSKGMRGN